MYKTKILGNLSRDFKNPKKKYVVKNTYICSKNMKKFHRDNKD